MDDKIISDLSPEFKSTYEKLRDIIERDYGPEEAESEHIYRFLKAREFDLIKAEEMLRNHIKWRQEEMKKLTTYKMSELQKSIFRIIGVTFTKEGEPLVYINSGNVDFKGLFKSVKVEEVLTGLVSDVFDTEKALETQSIKLCKKINKWAVVMDYENLQISQVLHKPNIDFYLQIFGIYESNFPERLSVAYMINASYVFQLIFNIIKPILSGSTLSKIKFFGKNGWKEELLDLVDAEDLPVVLGGNKTGHDGNPFCHLLEINGPVPKHLYFRSPERRLRGKDHVKEYILKRGEKYNLEFNVNTPECTICWNFETERGDLSFGLFYNQHEKLTPVEEIIPKKTTNSHMEMEEGYHICDKRGIYFLTFDNSNSWMREKHVFCRAYVVYPNGSKIFITS